MLDTGLRGKVCLVTGAANGIGRACAEILREQDAELVLCDQDEAGLEAAVAGLRIAADLRRREEVDRLFGELRRGPGRIDVLIHCAGVYRTTPLPEVTDDEWELVIDVNLRSSFMLCQRAVESMRGHGDGRIVLFGSFAARTGGLRAGVHYAASKAGVEGLMRNVALWAGPLGVRVNCVHPAMADTAMISGLSQEARDEAALRTPLRRTSTAREQAMMAVVLASDIASYVHGVALDVNGGMYMA